MADIHAHITDELLTGWAQDAAATQIESLYLAQWFPFEGVDDIRFAIEQDGAKVLEIAEFAHHDAEAKLVGAQASQTTTTGEIPALKLKSALSAYRQLRQRANSDDAILEQALRDVESHVDGIVARLNLAMGDALELSQVTYTMDRGFDGGIVTDYARDAALTVTVGTAWTDHTNATAFSDTVDANATFKTETGEDPWVHVISQTYLSHYLQNDEVRASIGATGVLQGTVSPRATRRQINELSEDHGLAPFVVFDDHYNGTRVLPENASLLLPQPSPRYARLLGTDPLEADGLNLSTRERRGIIGSRWMKKDPPVLWTKASTIALPAIGAPNKFMTLYL